MPSCEKCWNDAGSDLERYYELLDGSECTAEEQAGDYASRCPLCRSNTVHVHAKVCMTPGCNYGDGGHAIVRAIPEDATDAVCPGDHDA